MDPSRPKHPGGRPPIIRDGKPISVRVSSAQLAWLDEHGNHSQVVRDLIDAAMKRDKRSR